MLLPVTGQMEDEEDAGAGAPLAAEVSPAPPAPNEGMPLSDLRMCLREARDVTMPLANGTWVEFTAMREMSDGVVRHLDKAWGVVVDSDVLDGVGYYMVQHYAGKKPVPAPSRYPVRDDPLLIRALTNMPPLRILPERAAAIQAEAKMSADAKRS